MKELSLNILDVTENSVKAGATLTEILIEETADVLSLSIKDNGCGMTDEIEKSVVNPFYTTRTTRSVGLGIPLLKLAAEQTGGKISIESATAEETSLHGTTVSATFYKNHIDFTPLGDIVSTVTTLIQGHPDTNFRFSHKTGRGEVSLDTRDLREVLEDVPLSSYEVLEWIRENLTEQYENLKN
jgi:hypothetical protein